MTSYRKTGISPAPTYTGPGGHFTPGFWRPDKSSGKIAVSEGPAEPLPDRPLLTDDDSGRLRDPRTAENIARHEAALAPRRWTPPERREP